MSEDGDQARPQNAGSHGEAGKADQEDGLAPINIAKPSAGDEKDRINHGVAGNDELRVRRRGLQTRRDRRHRDNDDEEVEQRQKRTHQQTRERPPPPWIDILDLVRRSLMRWQLSAFRASCFLSLLSFNPYPMGNGEPAKPIAANNATVTRAWI